MALSLITRDSVATYLQGAEIDLVPEDKLGAMITAQCNQVACFVNASGKYGTMPLNTDMVPEELVKDTCVLLRTSILSMYPGTQLAESLEGDVRKAEYRTAVANMEAVKAGDFRLGDVCGDESHEVIYGGPIYMEGFETPL